MKKKHLAFVHDWILFSGGAEDVFFQIIRGVVHDTHDNRLLLSQGKISYYHIEQYEIKIFCLFSRTDRIKIDEVELPVISVMNLSKHPRLIRWYRYMLPLFPFFTRLLQNKIRKYNPDHVYVSHFAAVKKVLYNGPKNFLYIHSPMQYIWEMYTEYKMRFPKIIRPIYAIIAGYLRLRDKNFSCQICQHLVVNSEYTRNCVKKIYRCESVVCSPLIVVDYAPQLDCVPKFEYFIYVGRLVQFAKHVDKIIEACTLAQKHLLILGTGPDEGYLKQESSKYIHFWGHVADKNIKLTLLAKANGLINITKESYGMITAEAKALNVPIIGRHEGATPDLLSGYPQVIFINNRSIDTIVHAIKHCPLKA